MKNDGVFWVGEGGVRASFICTYIALYLCFSAHARASPLQRGWRYHLSINKYKETSTSFGFFQNNNPTFYDACDHHKCEKLAASGYANSDTNIGPPYGGHGKMLQVDGGTLLLICSCETLCMSIKPEGLRQ